QGDILSSVSKGDILSYVSIGFSLLILLAAVVRTAVYWKYITALEHKAERDILNWGTDN
ncbi:unnamed protein product, partial [marine sediment metagenome]